MIRAILSAALLATSLATMFLATMFSATMSLAVAQTSKPPAHTPVAPAPTPAPVSADPAMTSATYGDWVLRCQRLGDGDKANRVCEVAQTIQLPNQPNPIAEIAFGRPPGDPALHLTAVLPASVTFPSSVQVATADKPPHGLDLQWRRCLAGGCFADTLPSDDDVKVLRAATEAGHLTFKDAGARDVVLPVSFRGLAQALDALAKS